MQHRDFLTDVAILSSTWATNVCTNVVFYKKVIVVSSLQIGSTKHKVFTVQYFAQRNPHTLY